MGPNAIERSYTGLLPGLLTTLGTAMISVEFSIWSLPERILKGRPFRSPAAVSDFATGRSDPRPAVRACLTKEEICSLFSSELRPNPHSKPDLSEQADLRRLRAVRTALYS